MSNNSKRAVAKLKEEIEADLGSFNDDLLRELKAQTPVQSGRARRGWTSNSNPSLSKPKDILASNRVPYIDRLDEGSSQQAPDGIVEPAMQKALRGRG